MFLFLSHLIETENQDLHSVVADIIIINLNNF